MTWTRIAIDMDVVRELHAKGWRLKAIAVHLGVHYNTLNNHTIRAGLRFRNSPKRKPLPTHCANGHALTDTNSRLVERKRQRYRLCMVCHKHGNAARAAAGGADSLATVRRDQDRTRTILALYDEREHAPHWEKPEITARIEALRA